MTIDDVRIMGDVVLASIVAGGLRLAVVKGIIEPIAAAAGRRGWAWADRLLGDRLPNLPR